MFWLAVFTEFGLKAFKTGAYYMVHFEQMLVLSETRNVNILNQNLTL